MRMQPSQVKVTNYIAANNFGFSIPVTTSINGIQLDVEKAHFLPYRCDASWQLDCWFKPVCIKWLEQNAALFVSTENGNGPRDATAVSYGGQSLTPIASGTTGTSGGFVANMEFWILLESSIASATSTAFSVTFATTTLVENVQYYASAVYAGLIRFFLILQPMCIRPREQVQLLQWAQPLPLPAEEWFIRNALWKQHNP